MAKRNYNIDILRAMAILLILLYHCWVKCGSVQFTSSLVTLLISMGGETGVTAFFALSGYGIFCSLRKSEDNGNLSFKLFMKKRFRRVLPQYLACIIIYYTLLGGDLFSSSGVKNIGTHLLFIHNFFPDYHGAINGVLWTMGVIVQFYFLAIPLYLCVKKWRGKTVLISIVFTVIMKMLTYHFILPFFSGDQTFYFIYGRQLFTSLDNFVIGMYVAAYLQQHDKPISVWKALPGVALGVVGIVLLCCMGNSHGVWVDDVCGYIWHSGLAAGLAIAGTFFARIKISEKNLCARLFLWISRYEYGIYVWHLLIINSILGVSPWIWDRINHGQVILVYVIFILLSVLVGYLMSKGFDEITFSKKMNGGIKSA